MRRGVLILRLAGETDREKTNMERWRFVLPVPFERHLPPLVESVTRLDGEGDWRRDVARARSCEPSSIRQPPRERRRQARNRGSRALFRGKAVPRRTAA